MNTHQRLMMGYGAVAATARPLFVAVQSSVSSSAEFTATLPTGWVAGQLAVLHVASITSTLATPAGWTKVGADISAGTGTTFLFWRILQAGDVGPSIAAGTNRVAVIWTFDTGTFNTSTPVVQIATHTSVAATSTTHTVGASSSVTAGEHYHMHLVGAGSTFQTVSSYPYASANHNRGIGTTPDYVFSRGCGANFNGGVSAASQYTVSASAAWVSRKIAIIGLGFLP